MREIKIAALIGALCLLAASRVEATEPCQSLQGATLEALISYLNTTLPNDGNAECLSYAITLLGPQRYEPAIRRWQSCWVFAGRSRSVRDLASGTTH
jgi:hypothetical protein